MVIDVVQDKGSTNSTSFSLEESSRSKVDLDMEWKASSYSKNSG